MSFSSGVKEELAKHVSSARHCQIAELSAMMHYIGQYGMDKDGNFTIGFQTENEAVIRKCFTLLKKTYNIDTEMISDKKQIEQIIDKFGNLDEPVNPLILRNSCCQRAFLRGAYLCIGSMSDPEKSYHLEFVCTDSQKAEQLKAVIRGFDIDARIVLRKKYFVVYIKEGSGIVDLLNVMEAHVSLMEFENLRIVKEMRNSINRRVNCEAANITKTVNASSRQIEDILLIRDRYGFQNLSEPLRQMAEVRLEYPEAALKELGTYMDPPIGKSGVNHRLRKLGELADKIRL